jgi:hypothetical protein
MLTLGLKLRIILGWLKIIYSFSFLLLLVCAFCQFLLTHANVCVFPVVLYCCVVGVRVRGVLFVSRGLSMYVECWCLC